jgi:hypothetical protein
MKRKKELIIFCFGFILALIYWRIRVLFLYQDGKLPILREITGLTIHHYHYGLVILTISLLAYLFYKRNNILFFFIGFGLGSVLDSFMSRLFKSSNRMGEIMNYNYNFLNTIFLFGIVILIGVIFYLLDDKPSSEYLKSSF